MGLMKKPSACSTPVYPAVDDAKAAIEYYESRRGEDTRNPDPDRFVIEHCESVGRFVVVRVRYPNCVNYEGRKTLVYENIKDSKLRSLQRLDPHFCDHAGHISPVARFAPTTKGWQYAVAFCVFVTATDKLKR